MRMGKVRSTVSFTGVARCSTRPVSSMQKVSTSWPLSPHWLALFGQSRTRLLSSNREWCNGSAEGLRLDPLCCPVQCRCPGSMERRTLFADGSSTSRSAATEPAKSTTWTPTARRRLSAFPAARPSFAYGVGLAQAPPSRGRVAVSGTGVAVDVVTLTGTSKCSTLSFDGSGGDGKLTVGRVSADGALKR